MPLQPVLGMSPYLWIMIVFLIILVIALVLGDVLDVDHDLDVGGGGGLSPLSLPIISAFGTTFGGVAALIDATGWPTGAVIGVGVVTGVIVAAGTYFLLVNIFVKAQASSDVVLPELIGQEGNVTIPISPGQTGQVLLTTTARRPTLLSAISTEEIKTDETVVIEGVAGTSVRVKKVN